MFKLLLEVQKLPAILGKPTLARFWLKLCSWLLTEADINQ